MLPLTNTTASLYRLLDEAASFGPDQRWDNLRHIFDSSRKLLESPLPDLLLVFDSTDPVSVATAEGIRSNTTNWKFHIASDSPDKKSFFDAGIVITHSTQPFRQTESQLLSDFSSHVGEWSIFCLGIGLLEEDEAEELEQFALDTLGRISGTEQGRIWESQPQVLEGLSFDLALTKRPIWIIGLIHSALSKYLAQAVHQKREIDAQMLSILPNASDIQIKFQRVEQNLDLLAKKVNDRVNNMDHEILRTLSELLDNAESDLYKHIESTRKDFLVDSTNLLISNELRSIAEAINSAAQEKIESLIDDICQEHSRILTTIDMYQGNSRLYDNNNANLSLVYADHISVEKISTDELTANIRNVLTSAGFATIIGGVLDFIAPLVGTATFVALNRITSKQNEKQARQTLHLHAREILRKSRLSMTQDLQKLLKEVNKKLGQSLNSFFNESRQEIITHRNGYPEVIRWMKLQSDLQQANQAESRLRELLIDVERLQDRYIVQSLQQTARESR